MSLYHQIQSSTPFYQCDVTSRSLFRGSILNCTNCTVSMDALTSSSSERRWYNTLELIPLVILQNLAYGFTTASVVKFLYLIECGTFSPSDPGGVPGSVCHEPSALAAIKQDAFLCVGVTTVSAIVVSGVYSHRLNGGERKKAMGVAASTQLLGSLWGLFLRTSQPECFD